MIYARHLRHQKCKKTVLKNQHKNQDGHVEANLCHHNGLLHVLVAQGIVPHRVGEGAGDVGPDIFLNFWHVGWRPTLLGWRPSLLGWRPPLLGWRPSLLGWRPPLLGWRPSLSGWRSSLLGWRPSLLGRRPSLPGWRPSLLGWRPSPLGWRPSLLGWRPTLLGWAIAIRLEDVGGHRF